MPRPSTPDPTLVTAEVLRGWRLPEPDGDKNTRGSILVIGGSAETLGAVLLAAEAAMRAGAGKLQVATAASVAPPRRGGRCPRRWSAALPETDGGAIRADAADAVRDLAEAADAVLIGPGMADKEADPGVRRAPAPHLRGPLALDALGLACVTADDDLPAPPRRPGRAHAEPDGARPRAARRRGRGRRGPGRRRRWSSPAGRGPSSGWAASPRGSRPPTARLWRDDSGAAGLGVSGSGDVRAGITGGLLARGADPAQAAVWAAFLHGRCGERLSSSVGRLGFLARELPPEIPRALAEITG